MGSTVCNWEQSNSSNCIKQPDRPTLGGKQWRKLIHPLSHRTHCCFFTRLPWCPVTVTCHTHRVGKHYCPLYDGEHPCQHRDTRYALLPWYTTTDLAPLGIFMNFSIYSEASLIILKALFLGGGEVVSTVPCNSLSCPLAPGPSISLGTGRTRKCRQLSTYPRSQSSACWDCTAGWRQPGLHTQTFSGEENGGKCLPTQIGQCICCWFNR